MTRFVVAALVAGASAVKIDLNHVAGTDASMWNLLRVDQAEAGGPPSCGMAYNKLPDFARGYGNSISAKVCTHPGTKEACRVFDSTMQCWFRYMASDKCDGLPSLFKDRSKKLCEACNDNSAKSDWLNIWTFFSDAEKDWWRKNAHPLKDVEIKKDDDGEDEHTPEGSHEFATAFRLFGKEMMCATLHVFDDKCVKEKAMRCSKSGAVADKTADNLDAKYAQQGKTR